LLPISTVRDHRQKTVHLAGIAMLEFNELRGVSIIFWIGAAICTAVVYSWVVVLILYALLFRTVYLA
jgi:hypothetical protein